MVFSPIASVSPATVIPPTTHIRLQHSRPTTAKGTNGRNLLQVLLRILEAHWTEKALSLPFVSLRKINLCRWTLRNSLCRRIVQNLLCNVTPESGVLSFACSMFGKPLAPTLSDPYDGANNFRQHSSVTAENSWELDSMVQSPPWSTKYLFSLLSVYFDEIRNGNIFGDNRSESNVHLWRN